MNYELFTRLATFNKDFKAIPSKTSLLAEGAVIDTNGSIQYKGVTYNTDAVKISAMPEKLRKLFVEQKQLQSDIDNIPDIPTADDNKKDNLSSLNKILFEQLQNIVDPEKETDMQQELKKANAVCNIADKLIGIADLSLRYKKMLEK